METGNNGGELDTRCSSQIEKLVLSRKVKPQGPVHNPKKRRGNCGPLQCDDDVFPAPVQLRSTLGVVTVFDSRAAHVVLQCHANSSSGPGAGTPPRPRAAARRPLVGAYVQPAPVTKDYRDRSDAWTLPVHLAKYSIVARGFCSNEN